MAHTLSIAKQHCKWIQLRKLGINKANVGNLALIDRMISFGFTTKLVVYHYSILRL